jgi:PKD domain/L,D-transpeptidase catalytic domain/Putative peptidoglycan binding domain
MTVRATIVAVVALAFAPAATAAAPPTIAATATVTSGAAPLDVVLTASGDAVLYHWDFGDGAAADGATVEHVYQAGTFTARVTGRSATGESATASIRVRSFALTLTAAKVVGYGQHLRFGGKLVPALGGKRISLYTADGRRAARGRTTRNGSFRIGVPVRRPGTYEARFGGAASNPVAVRVRPALSVSFLGSGVVGRPLQLAMRLRPASAGPVRVEISRRGRLVASGEYNSGARIRLPSGRVAEYRITLSTAASAGYASRRISLRKIVFYPRLAVGATGPSVLALNEALDRLHIALAAADSSFGLDTRDAVVAFQKLHRLPRTGSVDARVWRVLSAARAPQARYPGDHIEISKPLQVLFVVRGGRVILVSHVSTGATGNTPVGRWRVYSKVPGWLPDGMFDSSFFLRGFAIHGYPSVPFYPGSHGCVRVPVWLAPRIYGYDPPGSTIYIY